MSGFQPASDQVSVTEEARWFVEEVQPHESALRGYLRAHFPSIDADDVVQESYLRVWNTVAVRRVRSARAFLFRVARNLALDVIRHERALRIVELGSLANLPVLEEGPTASDILSRKEKARLLGQALASLPTRCREIVFLHKIKGLSQRAVAERLGLSEKTVANQIGLGVARCEAFLRRRGIEFFLNP